MIIFGFGEIIGVSLYDELAFIYGVDGLGVFIAVGFLYFAMDFH